VELYKNDIKQLDITFKNLSPNDCPKISFIEIEIDGNIQNYQDYLESFFTFQEISKTNFFTDISNYISYELGQPTHCYEASKLNNELTFSSRECKDYFTTLHNENIQLEGINSIFTSNNEIISLAGVMGGKSTACSNNTKKVLVECAYFNPEAIIGKSIKYNIHSDAAHKFERGVDMMCQETALRRFIKIVEDHADIKSIKFKCFESKEYHEKHLPVDINKINGILGTEINNDDYVKYLELLNFDVKNEIIIPSFRHDISTQNDLAEEIARVIGYNNIISAPLNLNRVNSVGDNKIANIKHYLITNGFSEVINFPFTSNASEDSISIDNPLDSNRRNLRTNLKESLVQNLLFNERRQKDSIKLFEVSNVYKKDTSIKQNTNIGIIISGRRGHDYLNFSKTLNFDYLQNLLNKTNEIFHISEIPRNELDTKKKDKIFYTEITIDNIPENYFDDFKGLHDHKFFEYKPISEFPSSTRDFSFSISETDKYTEVLHMLNNLEDEHLKDAFIFDFYKNEKLNEVKIGIRLIFQSLKKTLSEDEIQSSIAKLLKPIVNIKGVTVPGLKINLY
jgi:phenylalanyl-tRNA synthetase beta chain